MSLADRVASLDVSLFDGLETQMTSDDRRSLLAIHHAAAEAGDFEYLEIGSHVGGSLQALVRDPRCTRIVSIDSRPESQPDERGRRFAYADNTSARMLELLGELDGADVGKVEAIDATTSEVDSGSVGAPLVLLVDAEHTDEAALADARWCRSVIDGGSGLIAFHDAWIVHRAIRRFLGELGESGFNALLLPESVVVVELGRPRLTSSAAIRGRAEQAVWGYLDSLERQAAYRDAFVAAERSRLARVRRLLRR